MSNGFLKYTVVLIVSCLEQGSEEAVNKTGNKIFQVTLVLGSDPPHRAPVFVLHSQEPLHWMLPSPPGKNWTFQVRKGKKSEELAKGVCVGSDTSKGSGPCLSLQRG